MTITAEDVKKLRDMTGAGMMEAKSALTEANGDFDQAIAVLKSRGAAIAEKKADRVAANGVIATYVHTGSKLAVLVEVLVETDFVARDEKFVTFANQIAMHIAGMNPKYLNAEDVSDEDKGENLGDIVLLKQPFLLDNSKTVEDVMNDMIAQFKENIKIGRFVRMEMGIPPRVC